MVTAEVMRLENLKQDLNNKIGELSQNQVTNEASPLSVFAKAADARAEIESLVKSEIARWDEELKGSVELYWLRNYLVSALEQQFAEMDMKEITFRLKLLREVEEKFLKLLPLHMRGVKIESQESCGKTAVALSEVQGTNAAIATEVLALEDEEYMIKERIERTEVATTNAIAASELCEFEARVLNYCATTGVLPKPATYPEQFGVPILEQLQERKAKLKRDIQETERDLVTLREQLVRAIDASQVPQSQGLARQLFTACEKITRKYKNDVVNLNSSNF